LIENLIFNKKKLERMIEDLLFSKKELSILKNSQESTSKKKDKDTLLLQ
jgi:hypothetical protein